MSVPAVTGTAASVLLLDPYRERHARAGAWSRDVSAGWFGTCSVPEMCRSPVWAGEHCWEPYHLLGLCYLIDKPGASSGQAVRQLCIWACRVCVRRALPSITFSIVLGVAKDSRAGTGCTIRASEPLEIYKDLWLCWSAAPVWDWESHALIMNLKLVWGTPALHRNGVLGE